MWKYLNKDCNCNTTPTNPGVVCNHDGLKANDLVYKGTDVPCSGIYNGMPVSEVLQQMDYYLCSLEFTQLVLTTIQENTERFSEFITLVNGVINCETIGACGNPPSTTTTTSTSSTTSTTTSTTTLFPPECIEVEINVGTNCPGQSYAILGYTDCNGIAQEVEVGTGDLPRFCVLDNPYPSFMCGDGTIDIIGKCDPITTTTTTADTSCTQVGIDAGTTCPGQEYAIVQYTDCEGNVQTIQVGPGELPIVCMLNSSTPVYLCGDGGFQYGEVCFSTTTTTSTIVPITTTTTTTLLIPTTTTTTTVASTTTTTTLAPITTTTTTSGSMLAFATISSTSNVTDACGEALDTPCWVSNVGGFPGSETVSPSSIIYTDAGGTTPFIGNGEFYHIQIDLSSTSASCEIDSTGNVISGVALCF